MAKSEVKGTKDIQDNFKGLTGEEEELGQGVLRCSKSSQALLPDLA